MEKHPDWKQNTPKDQMNVILTALKGNIENIHIISPKKLVEKVMDCVDHLRMLSEYMNSKWEDKMNLGELLKEELKNELKKQQDVKYPICPLEFYFEGDEDKCDQSKCDYRDGFCESRCEIKRKEQFEKVDDLTQEDNEIKKENKIYKTISYHIIDKTYCINEEEKEEVEVCVGCNGKEHAITVTRIFGINNKTVHAEHISECKIGKCSCKTKGGFILHEDLKGN